MNALRLSLMGVIASAILALPVFAADLGDAAPALKVEKWIKGGPVDVKDGKNVYVVEFWATWCAPCRASIPHLTELQKTYKDKGVVVVGVSVDEGEKRKTRDTVEPFVQENGDKMSYAVALDEPDRPTKAAYMEGFVFDGIPTAFVIDKSGKVVWAGQPDETPGAGVVWSGLDQAVEQVVAGKYDLKAAQQADKDRRVLVEKRRKAMEAADKYLAAVKASEKPEGVEKLGQDALAALGQDADLLNGFAWSILTDEDVKLRDLKFALQVAKAAYDACAGKQAAIIDTYARALFDNGQKKEALAYQKKAVQLAGDDEPSRADLEATLKRYEAAQK
jgi:thiol-disulfide isomerase/thioredoxin